MARRREAVEHHREDLAERGAEHGAHANSTRPSPIKISPATPAIVLSVLLSLAVAAVAVLKGKVFLGVAGMLFLPAGLVGAIRLAKPGSPWARGRYPEGSRKRIESERRFERHTRRYQRFQDRVAGAPGSGEQP